jgi:hypothetical protein
MERLIMQSIRIWITGLLLLAAGVLALGQDVFEERVLNHRASGMLFGETAYHVCVVSNIPRDALMATLCGRVALARVDRVPIKVGDRKVYDHCVYYPLAAMGACGPKGRDLLPFDPMRGVMTLLVVDQSTLTEEERALFDEIRALLFPTLTELKPEQVTAWVHTRGRTRHEYQVMLSLPEARWLAEVRADLAYMPPLTAAAREPFVLERPVVKTALLTNDPQVRALVSGATRYNYTRVYGLNDFDQFRDWTAATRRVIALNWNGDEECSPAMAVQVLPAALRGYCSALAPDRMGVTGWQRFCRTAVAQRFEEEGRETWVIGAPTAGYLRTLATQVVKSRFAGGPYQIDLCDLTYLNRLAVGVYLASPDPDRSRLVLQQQLEQVAAGVLGPKVVPMVSTQNWGETLQTALGRDPATDAPFSRPEAQRVVNQSGNADAVLLLWVKTLAPQVRYELTRTRLTPAFPAFDEPEPREPRAPDPDDFILFLGHKYPGHTYEERRDSREFRRDYHEWREEEHPRWEAAHRRWEERRSDWAYRRASYRVNYEYYLKAVPRVALTGYLKLIDLKATQRVLWSTDLALDRTGDPCTLRTIPAQAAGEGVEPVRPAEIARVNDAYTWGDTTQVVGGDTVYGLGQTVLLDTLRDGLTRLSENVLWAADMKPWNLPVRRVRE